LKLKVKDEVSEFNNEDLLNQAA